MTRIFLWFGAALWISSCGQVPVSISMQKPRPTSSLGGSSLRESSPLATTKGLVVFEAIEESPGTGWERAGFGFKSSGAAADVAPLIRRLSREAVAPGTQTLTFFRNAQGRSQAYFFSSQDAGLWDLTAVDLVSLHETNLISVTQAPVFFSSVAGGAEAGWAAADGKVEILSLGDVDAGPHVLTTGAKRVRWLPSLGWAAVSASGRIRVFNPSFGKEFSGDDLSSFGRRLAVTRRKAQQGGVLSISDGEGHWASFAKDAQAAHEPAWDATGVRLAFWVERSGIAELRVLDTTSGVEEKVSWIQKPADLHAMSDADGWICPAWKGNTLYFASSMNGFFGILRAKKVDGAWKVEPFALAGTENQHWVCPRVSEGGGS